MLRPWFTLLTPENHLNLLFIFPSVLTLVWFLKGAGCEQGITSIALQCVLSCFSAQHSPSTIEHMLVSLDLCVPVCPIILQLHRWMKVEQKHSTTRSTLVWLCEAKCNHNRHQLILWSTTLLKIKAHLFPTKSYVFFFYARQTSAHYGAHLYSPSGGAGTSQCERLSCY